MSWIKIDRKHYDRQIATLGPRLSGENRPVPSTIFVVRERRAHAKGEWCSMDLLDGNNNRLPITIQIAWLQDRCVVRRWFETDKTEELFETKEFNRRNPEGVLLSWLQHIKAVRLGQVTP